MAAFVEKLFEANIPPETIRMRARVAKGWKKPKKSGRGESTAPSITPSIPSTIPNNHVEPPATPQIHSEFPEKRSIQPVRDEAGMFVEGKPPGPGRPPKHKSAKYAGPFIEAMLAAGQAIKQLSMIADDDATRFLGRVRASAKGRVRGGGRLAQNFLWFCAIRDFNRHANGRGRLPIKKGALYGYNQVW